MMILKICRQALLGLTLILVMIVVPVLAHADSSDSELTERFLKQAKDKSDKLGQQIEELRKQKCALKDEQACADIGDEIASLRVARTELDEQMLHHSTLMRRGWRIVFFDEFSGSQLDEKQWSHEVNCSGGGNNEQQCYTANKTNSFVSNDNLHLVAKEGNHSGSPVFDDHPAYDPKDKSKTLPFTSARVRSKNKIDFKYGRVEVRARIAAGQGIWPAIWMLPTDSVYGPWPRSGEIDILEAVNLGVGPKHEIHGTLHYGLDWPQWENHGKTLPLETNPADAFHVYAIEWEADEIRWYFDGKHYQTQRSEGWHNYIWHGQKKGFDVANPRAPFDQNFHLIMNLAVGGDWPGAPDRNWQSDRDMQIDYVRVYQCHPSAEPAVNTELGEGCATVDHSIEVNTAAARPVTKDFVMYADGAETLQLKADDALISNTFAKGFWEPKQGTVQMSDADVGGDRGTVWRIQFKGDGHVFLTSQNGSTDSEQSSGLALVGGSGWSNNGELEFDMRITQASADSVFMGKVDSGGSKVGQVQLEQVTIGQWVRVSIRMSDLLSSSGAQAEGIDLATILRPFVLQYSGSGALIEVDNIRLQCAINPEPESWQRDKDCGISPAIAAN